MKIEPCPFCGVVPVPHKVDGYIRHPIVNCPMFDASVHLLSSWNSRPPTMGEMLRETAPKSARAWKWDKEWGGLCFRTIPLFDNEKTEWADTPEEAVDKAWEEIKGGGYEIQSKS